MFAFLESKLAVSTLEAIKKNADNGCEPTCTATAQGALPAIFAQITSLIIFLVGAIAVIMLIVGGLRYVLSSGNSQQVNEAKNTILYSVIGIVIAVSAYAIVTFVFGRLNV